MFLLKARVLSLEPCLIEWICRDSFCSNPEPCPAKCHPVTGNMEQWQTSAWAAVDNTEVPE